MPVAAPFVPARGGRLRLTLLLAAGALTATACGAAPSPPDASVAVSDSAGIRLVRNLSPALDTSAFQLVEELRIGVLDGAAEYMFSQVTGVATDAQGRIFVADRGDHAVRIFDRDGRLVRGFGSPGQGPGEFTWPYALFVWRDTVHVANDGRGRTSMLFDTTGALLATLPQTLPDGSMLATAAASPAGWYLFDDSLFARQRRDRAGDITRSRTVIRRMAPANLQAAARSRGFADSVLVPVLEYERGRIFWALGSEGGSEQFPLGNPPFFEPSPSHAFDAHGYIHVARSWPYAVETYDTDGVLVRRITRAHDSIPVTPALIERTMSRVRAHYDSTGQLRSPAMQVYERRAGFPPPPFVPVTSTVHTSRDGWLWVRRPDLEPDITAIAFATGLPPRPSHWDVFDPDGVLRGTVRLPPRFLLRVVEAESIIGIQRDDFDVPYIVRYRLHRRGG